MNPLNMLLLAQDTLKAADAATEAAEATTGGGWLVFLIIVAIIVVPFLIGNFIAQALKMKEAANRIGLVLFALTLGVIPFVTHENPLDAISLGIDLAGGANMTFEVDHSEAEAQEKIINLESMSKLKDAVSRRVNPTGTEEVTVRVVGQDRIEIIIPGVDQEKVKRTRELVTELGELEFTIIANVDKHADLIQYANSLPNADKIYNVKRGDDVVALWRPSAMIKDKDGKATSEAKFTGTPRLHSRTREVNGKQIQEFLCVVDPDNKRRIKGRLLKSVRETVTDRGLACGFTFNDRGGYLFQQLTSAYQPVPGGDSYHLGVLLNNELHSAPTVNAVISGSGVIEGNFSPEELDELLSVLNAGALDIPLKKDPVTEFSVSPTLGVDVQKKGFTAIAIALVAVLIVTLVYYLKSGFIADVCLALNIILVLGTMAIIDATFTLPGLAGLVLTIGMAVDANVLIFERMREEKDKGSSLRMSIKNGFEKAFSTIFDANVTTLITAVVLYYIGTDQVKGFAVTLFIGILMSMFSALFVGRLIFDIAENKRWIKELKMMSLIKPEGINFIGKRGIAAMASAIVIAVGLGAVAMRGVDNLDIDFRGGSMVAFQFDGDQPTIDEVRDAVNSKFESTALEKLAIGESGETLFRMRTTEPDANNVSQGVKEVFAATPYSLLQQHLTFGEVKEIPAASETAAEDVPFDVFSGGHEVAISVTEKMSPGAISDEVVKHVKALDKYDDVKDLVKSAAIGSEDPKVNEIQLNLAQSISAEDVDSVLASLKDDLEKNPYFAEVNTYSSAVAGEMKTTAISAMIISLLAIVGYLWLRFQRVTFGLAACAALVHDVLCVLGLVALASFMGLDYKINLPMVAAFLTIVGYSLNDTIVVFDRIREVRGRNPALTTSMVNQSLNQTLSRTLLTSLTTLVVVLILFFMGGEGIEGFAYCLIVGVLVGTYSSIYVASPVLIWLMNREQKTATAT